jgi:hypothetical protein
MLLGLDKEICCLRLSGREQPAEKMFGHSSSQLEQQRQQKA